MPHSRKNEKLWRTGRTVGRTIYRQKGDADEKGDKLIGVMDDAADADLVVKLHNLWAHLQDMDPPLESLAPQ